MSEDIKISSTIELSKLLEGLNMSYSEILLPKYNNISEVGISPQQQFGTSPTITPQYVEFTIIKGIMVDSETFSPLKGVNIINILKQQDKTNSKGEFKIEIPLLLNTPFDPKHFYINIVKKGYSPSKVIPYTSTLDVKKDLGIIELDSIDVSLLEDKRNFLKISNEETKEYVEKDITIEFYIEKELNTSINNLKKLVIPLLLGLLSQYGISKVKGLIEENKNNITDELKQLITCPSKEDLNKIVETKNKLVKQINNTFTIINGTTEIISLTQPTISTFSSLLPIIENLPLPTAVGGVGVPISLINGVQKIIRFLNKIISKLEFSNSSLTSHLTSLRETLIQVLDILSFLDKVTQYCSSNEEITQEQISQELTNFTIEQSQQLSPIIINVNGFKMGVETEKTTNSTKRRRAIAQNKQGIIMLRGEWSFSSIDQILIDELVFYIQQNNLKAD